MASVIRSVLRCGSVVVPVAGLALIRAHLFARRVVSRPPLPAVGVPATFFALVLSFAPAGADPIAYFTGPLSSGAEGLLQIDLATGQVTEIGPYGLDVRMRSLAFAPNGTLYGTGSTLEGRAYVVVVDPTTGSATVQAELTAQEPSIRFDAMTADACGRLWAQGFVGTPSASFRDVVARIHPTTGEVVECQRHRR